MVSEARHRMAPAKTALGSPEPPPSRRRPDPEMVWALCKGVWSTLFTIVTLSAAIFVCSHVEPKGNHAHPVGAARHD